MNLKELTREWADGKPESHAFRELSVRLPLHRAAQVAALAEMFADADESKVIADVLAAALSEIEAAFPYVPGRQVGEDELGDPVYEDAGHTPRFEALTRAHFERLRREAS